MESVSKRCTLFNFLNDMDTYNLSRFLTAQNSYSQYEMAFEEIRVGRKRNHWMWFVFPQLKGLGSSYNADFYGITGTGEAQAYWRHPVLGERLREITEVLLLLEGLSARKIFGSIDAVKLRSSMTLFWEVTGEKLFQKVLDKYFEGELCGRTLEMLR